MCATYYCNYETVVIAKHYSKVQCHRETGRQCTEAGMKNLVFYALECKQTIDVESVFWIYFFPQRITIRDS